MSDDSHHEESEQSPQNSRERQVEYGNPVFTSPPISQTPQIHITASNTTSTFGPPQGQVFSSYPQQTFTTLPPINIGQSSSGVRIQGSQPIAFSNQSASIPSQINVPGGIIIGPPISIPGTVQGGIPNRVPFGYQQQIHYQTQPPSFNPSFDMVPRAQFQKCAQQCHIWQAKYRQLNNKYISLLNQRGSGQPIDQARLREQNYALQQKVLAYQASQRQLAANIDVYITNLINKYKEATLRESAALFQQFKRQTRTHSKPF